MQLDMAQELNYSVFSCSAIWIFVDYGSFTLLFTIMTTDASHKLL